MMNEETPVLRTIVRHASGDALAPATAQMLTRLGYRILEPEDFDRIREASPELAADLLLVDERRLSEISEGEESTAPLVPIILLCGRQGATGADTRIVGSVKRPAGIHDLYRLMQQVFEDTPRTTPRVATQIRARCEVKGTTWEGRVLSLSENGCLLRTAEPILLGQTIRLELMLPRSEPIPVEAEAAYQLLPDLGLVFHAVAPAHRETLSRFVSEAILGN